MALWLAEEQCILNTKINFCKQSLVKHNEISLSLSKKITVFQAETVAMHHSLREILKVETRT